jgi:hypothetical protein
MHWIASSAAAPVATACRLRTMSATTTAAPRLVRLTAVCGPLDIDNSQPAITVMLMDKD